MARYMLTENAFLPDGFLHEAALERPKVITTPDDLIPSLTWMPLDKPAVEALTAIAKEKYDLAVATGTPKSIAARQFKIKKMPPGADKMYIPAESIKEITPRKAVTQEDLENDAFKKLAEASAPGMQAAVAFAAAAAASEGGRPSDTEPE